MNKISESVIRKQLADYKELIDKDIIAYSRHVQDVTLQQFGKNARVETDAYLDILVRGGKRIRGVLTMVGYEMSGGKDGAMILQAARAVEMLHAYILIIDDIQDRSAMRRGGESAHTMLARYHRDNKLAGDSEHFGTSIAINSALSGAHAAQVVLANLNVDPDLRLKAISIMNRTMMVTSHGQTNDIFNEVSEQVTEDDVERVLEWKTAHYTFLNPLHMGMVLAGADCSSTDAITDYAIHTGKAFQVLDDIKGVFGQEHELGKSTMDDFREGKRTILSVFALENANLADKNFLLQMLGNQNITKLQFERCKAILVSSGALKYAEQRLDQHVKIAKQSLQKNSARWNCDQIEFLLGITDLMSDRRH